MPFTIYDSGEGKKPETKATSVAPGVIKSNCDLIMQGKLMVRIPSKGIDVWARKVNPGAGPGYGVHIPDKVGEEVLVMFNEEDPRDAYILGSMNSSAIQPPFSIPTDSTTKLIIRTGIPPVTEGPVRPKPILQHEIELDDVEQKITIKAALGQTIELTATGIKIAANANTTIEMTAAPQAGPGVVSITCGTNKILMSPKGIEIQSSAMLTLTASNINLNAGDVSIKGVKVSLNS